MTPLCFCKRAPRGFAFHRIDVPAWSRPPAVHCCSMQHLQFITDRKGATVAKAELDKLETEAIANASEAAGAYLEQIGKTDLAAMTGDEWLGFLGSAFTAITGELGRLVQERETPF